MKKTILTTALTLLLATSTAIGDTTATSDTAARAIAAAETARNQAASAGYEWRDTAKLIDAARKAAEAKKYEEAIAMAGKAERQSLNAIKQHKGQAAKVAQ